MSYDYEKNMTNHPPVNDGVVERFDQIRSHFKAAAIVVDAVCPESREKSLALTGLEQALMWAIASVARNQDQVTA